VVAFWLCWGALVAQRLEELVRARGNTRRLLQQGAVEVAGGHYPLMVLLHLGWFAGWLAEAQICGVSWNPAWWPLALAGQGLRLWAQAVLGPRWTTRILVVPGELPVQHGPFALLRHPNYLGVVFELLAFPMIFGAWRTALAASLLNAALLSWRIRQEERAWSATTPSGN
jgi:methyltransferase